MDHTPKRIIAAFLPYRVKGDSFEFFLQRRSSDARTNPGKLGLFGGGAEGAESIEQVLSRELHEELSYTPSTPVFFARYEGPFDVVHVFTEEVGNNFEHDVVIGEGEYGIFIELDEILGLRDVTKLVQLAVEQFGMARGIQR